MQKPTPVPWWRSSSAAFGRLPTELWESTYQAQGFKPDLYITERICFTGSLAVLRFGTIHYKSHMNYLPYLPPNEGKPRRG